MVGMQLKAGALSMQSLVPAQCKWRGLGCTQSLTSLGLSFPICAMEEPWPPPADAWHLVQLGQASLTTDQAGLLLTENLNLEGLLPRMSVGRVVSSEVKPLTLCPQEERCWGRCCSHSQSPAKAGRRACVRRPGQVSQGAPRGAGTLFLGAYGLCRTALVLRRHCAQCLESRGKQFCS